MSANVTSPGEIHRGSPRAKQTDRPAKSKSALAHRPIGICAHHNLYQLFRPTLLIASGDWIWQWHRAQLRQPQTTSQQRAYPSVANPSLSWAVADRWDSKDDYPVVDASPSSATPCDFQMVDFDRVPPRFFTRHPAAVGAIRSEIYGLIRSQSCRSAPLTIVDPYIEDREKRRKVPTMLAARLKPNGVI